MIRMAFFLGLFAGCCVLSLAQPFAGIVAYVTHYHTAPEKAYWGKGLSAAGVRYSFTITACLALGTFINLKRLRYGRPILRQEALYLAFLGWIVVSQLIHGVKKVELSEGVKAELVARGQLANIETEIEAEPDAIDKMLKMSVFVLALTHIVVTPKRFSQFAWLLTLCGLYLGFECFTAPKSAFFKGRIMGIGGPDFAFTNALAAHTGALLPIIGVCFLRSGLIGKLVCLGSGALVANSLVMTRSRGAYLALAVALIMALYLAPKGQRKKIWLLIAVGCLGGLRLVDDKFMERMTTIAKGSQDTQGEHAESRLRVWAGGLRLLADNPLGVGPNNFAAYIGHYVPDEAGRDPHNTYLRCAADLGVPGIAMFGGLVVGAFSTLTRVSRAAARRPELEDCLWYAFALRISLTIYLTAAFFSSFIYTELLWWLLLLPAGLERALTNAQAELPPEVAHAPVHG